MKKFWLLLIIFLLALIVRIYGLGFGLPYQETPDEENLVRAVLNMGRSQLNPNNYFVPHLMFNLTFPAVAAYYGFGRLSGQFANPRDFALSYFRDTTPVFLIARAMSALVSSLAVVFLALLLWDLFGRRATVIGALTLTFFPLEVTYAHIFRPEAFLHFTGAGAIYFCCRLLEKREWRNFCWAGFWVGLAYGAKYSGLAYGLFYCLGFVLGESKFKKLFGLSEILKFSGGLLMIPIAFFLGSPYSLIKYSLFSKNSGHLFSHVTSAGHLGFESANAWLYYLFEAFPNTMTWPLMALTLTGMLISLKRRQKTDLFFLVFTLVFYYYIGSWRATFPRYYFPLIIPFVYFVATAYEYLIGKIRWLRVKPGLQVLGVVLFLSRPAYQVIMTDYYNTRPSTRVIAKKWIEKNIPPLSKIAMERYGPHLAPTKQEYERRLKHLKAKGKKGMRIQYLLDNYDESAPHYDWIYLWKMKADDPIKYLLENDFDYAIINERKYAAAYHKDSMVFHPELTSYYRRYYDYLWDNYKPLKEFIPASPYARGSRIVIFALKNHQNAG